jgi:hypothetical protein
MSATALSPSGELTQARPTHPRAAETDLSCRDLWGPGPDMAEAATALGGQSGMLPCLRFGFGSRFVFATSSAEISTGRVFRGSITSST